MRSISFKNASDKLILLFSLVPLWLVAASLLYYVLIMVFYHCGPNAWGGREVFFPPRYIGGQNDLSSSVFTQWRELMLLGPAMLVMLVGVFRAASSRAISFKAFLAAVYLTALAFETAFVMFTPHGLSHFVLQAQSINNGVWDGMHDFFRRLPGLKIESPYGLDALRYIFRELFANSPAYTITGATHPPGCMVLCLYLFRAVTLVPVNPAVAWTCAIMAINTLTIPVIGLLSKRLFSERIARLTCASLLAVPSVCLNYNAVLDGVPAFLTILGGFVVLEALGASLNLDRVQARKQALVHGLLAGLIFTLAAQFSYGHAVPIMAFLVAWLVMVDKSDKGALARFLLGLMAAPVAYFLFEYWISAGRSFYLARAAIFAKVVDVPSRKMPLTAIANFEVMAIMGGFYFMPALARTLWTGPASAARRLLRGPETDARRRLRSALQIAVFLMLGFLVFQRTVKLEVERTWNWLFAPVWLLSGFFLAGAELAARRLFPVLSAPRARRLSGTAVSVVQLLWSIALAMAVMDYY